MGSGDKGVLIVAGIVISAFAVFLIGTGYGLNKTKDQTYEQYKNSNWLGNPNTKSTFKGGKARRKTRKKK
jgi:hypothetical protein